ncbi:MAG: sodium:proton antiporter [Planctomycetes bacterium]|nr:sodium:proton antiporter [Planctomycetota bacterium]
MVLAFAAEPASSAIVPALFWVWPFVGLLLAIAILPLLRGVERWWHHNSSKLLVAAVLGTVTLGYYWLRGYGVAHGEATTEPGLPTVLQVLHHALLDEYLPFILLLFSLYVIAGGILVRGDILATPLNNTIILAIGSVLASLIGTTGASMVLIRLLLKTNSERRHVVHTVVFFIFLVSNIGGTLLPTGDPPLFLGYLRGVPFLWTLVLWREWALLCGALLVIYFIWDSIVYPHETIRAIREDQTRIEPIHAAGLLNILWLVLVVVAVAVLDPNKPIPFTQIHPWPFSREGVLLGLTGLSLATTTRGLRKENQFNYGAILEVACLFVGIFVTMQVPLEILHARGAELNVTKPAQFFWATGGLSSFLDNAPTYVVFLELAKTLTPEGGPGIIALLGDGYVRENLLIGVSLGAVFMGANTYIGNGPNFMVKTIAEQSGVKMPSFFGYMGYACVILLPLFALMTWWILP